MEKLWAEISTKHVTEELKAKSRKFQGKKSDTEKKIICLARSENRVSDRTKSYSPKNMHLSLTSIKALENYRNDPRPEYNCPYHYAETLGSGH